ncbi:MAG TPA: hypothetical protein VNQ76_15310 [Planctomicrobium sp.]|nr:hypothetical protein [Planctomicrobium sp.]
MSEQTQLEINFKQAQRDRMIERLGLSDRVTLLLKALDRLALERGIQDDFGVLLVDAAKADIAAMMKRSEDTAKRAWEDARQTPYLIVERSQNMAHNFAIQWPLIFSHSAGCDPHKCSDKGGAGRGRNLPPRGSQPATPGVATLPVRGRNLPPPDREKPNVPEGGGRGGSNLYEGEGEINSSSSAEGWQLARAILSRCGVGAVRPALQSAMDGGWSPDQVIALCEEFRKTTIDGVAAWGPRVLYGHLVNASPGAPIRVEPCKEYREKKAQQSLRNPVSREPVTDSEAKPAGVNLEEVFGPVLDEMESHEIEELVASCNSFVTRMYRKNGLTKSVRGALLFQLSRQEETIEEKS